MGSTGLRNKGAIAPFPILSARQMVPPRMASIHRPACNPPAGGALPGVAFVPRLPNLSS